MVCHIVNDHLPFINILVVSMMENTPSDTTGRGGQ